ncbi:GtrA family protein [Flavivirga eckloniae]|uniref:GtrA family protein n=1 Tax=Flavivirga eckloniae TaxID=1803846 RepID=A0A2K9PQQ2_9FLAO|nr:GtrA family protein [Flavivirga eckloniae]AUP79384.1 GtrA family protein [Flavivirga eckloniae]
MGIIKFDPKIKKQLLRFVCVGVLAVFVDFIVYFMFVELTDIKYAVAKFISFFSGTIVSYLINKLWTFEQKQRSPKQFWMFMILYIITLGVNVTVNTMVLSILKNTLLAFLCATGTSTILNFMGQKYWVFKEN